MQNKREIDKPATFDFLGFTHYCGKSKQGNFRVKRKTSRKKLQGKLKESKEWIKKNRNKDIHMIMDRFKRSLVGYYNYYCITDNTQSVHKFRDKIEYYSLNGSTEEVKENPLLGINSISFFINIHYLHQELR